MRLLLATALACALAVPALAGEVIVKENNGRHLGERYVAPERRPGVTIEKRREYVVPERRREYDERVVPERRGPGVGIHIGE